MVAGCLLLAGTAGCGSPVSDKPTNVDVRAGNGKPEDRTGVLQLSAGKSRQDDSPPRTATGSAGATLKPLPPSAGKSGQADAPPTTTTDSAGATLTPFPLSLPPAAIRQHDDDDLLNIPKAVAKDLNSSDARDRYRALDYWEEKDSKAPIDPVFDAMGDDDPAVRAKAAAIIERYTAAGEERE
jgi:hypothetical protein